MNGFQIQTNNLLANKNFNFIYYISPLFPNSQLQYYSRNYSNFIYKGQTNKDKMKNSENQQFDETKSINSYNYDNSIKEKQQIIPIISNNINYNIKNRYNSFSSPTIKEYPLTPTKNQGKFQNYIFNTPNPAARYVTQEEYLSLKLLKKKEKKLEKYIENYPKSVNSEKMSIILTQMEKTICKVKLENDNYGTGFFCNIPIFNDWNSLLRVFITNNHIINKNDIRTGKNIKLSINNDKKYINITIDENRITYTNKEYDVTIIEIKSDDGLDKESFLDIDNRFFEEKSLDIFIKTSIYLLHYPNKEKSSKSEGIISKINKNSFIEHFCDSNFGSSGGPLINLNNHKVIGIHIGAGGEGENYNIGVVLKLPIQKMNETMKNFEMKKKGFNKPRLFCNIF